EMLHDQDIEYRLELMPVSLPVSRELFDILLNNLLSNAIRHNTGQNGGVVIELTAYSLRVSNTGVGEALDSDRIFRRFYKNSGRTGDNGLGLSIIKQIC